MTTWWWIRHGPTHADGLIGWTDLPADLSDLKALARLEAHLPGDALVVSSDLSRSIATADAIQANRDRLAHAPALREMNFGTWEAKTFQEVSKTDPEISRAYWTTPGEVAPPEGESWNGAGDRVSAFVQDINVLHKGRHIIAVAHFGVILTQLQRAGRMSAKSAMSFKIDNLSVTRLEFLDPQWRVLGVNHCP